VPDKTGKSSKKSSDNPGGPEQPNEAHDTRPKLEDRASQLLRMRELECPAELPPLAREEWSRIVGELIALGALSKFDRGPLAIYCGAYAMWAEAMKALEEFGTMTKSPTGYPVQSPYVAIVNRQAELMLRIAGEFGFTPASRSRHLSYTKHRSMLLDASNEPTEFVKFTTRCEVEEDEA
jgi:P27 family predicted phage terminase small subunit